jgi:hypothetical protein
MNIMSNKGLQYKQSITATDIFYPSHLKGRREGQKKTHTHTHKQTHTHTNKLWIWLTYQYT